MALFDLSRLNYTITTLEAVKRMGGKVRMPSWYTRTDDTVMGQDEADRYRKTASVAEFHSCGNSACLVGWMTLTPLWRQCALGPAGVQSMGAFLGGCAFKHLTPEENTMAHSLVVGELVYDPVDIWKNRPFSKFYNKVWSDVNIDDVLAQLRILRNQHQNE